MNDEEMEDEMPYSCEKWGPCVLRRGHEGQCQDKDGDVRTKGSLLRERWGKV